MSYGADVGTGYSTARGRDWPRCAWMQDSPKLRGSMRWNKQSSNEFLISFPESRGWRSAFRKAPHFTCSAEAKMLLLLAASHRLIRA